MQQQPTSCPGGCCTCATASRKHAAALMRQQALLAKALEWQRQRADVSLGAAQSAEQEAQELREVAIQAVTLAQALLLQRGSGAAAAAVAVQALSQRDMKHVLTPQQHPPGSSSTSDQPGSTSDQPGSTSGQPGSMSGQPGNTSDQPDSTSDQQGDGDASNALHVSPETPVAAGEDGVSDPAAGLPSLGHSSVTRSSADPQGVDRVVQSQEWVMRQMEPASDERYGTGAAACMTPASVNDDRVVMGSPATPTTYGGHTSTSTPRLSLHDWQQGVQQNGWGQAHPPHFAQPVNQCHNSSSPANGQPHALQAHMLQPDSSGSYTCSISESTQTDASPHDRSTASRQLFDMPSQPTAAAAAPTRLTSCSGAYASRPIPTSGLLHTSARTATVSHLMQQTVPAVGLQSAATTATSSSYQPTGVQAIERSGLGPSESLRQHLWRDDGHSCAQAAGAGGEDEDGDLASMLYALGGRSG